MRRLIRSWPKLALIFVPLCIVAVDAGVLVHERRQPETDKAIRLVGESVSRKESFTVKQYVYATIYHRQAAGEEISIEGWRAGRSPDGEDFFVVEFRFTDSDGPHVATWRADVRLGTVAPQDQLARDLSWKR